MPFQESAPETSSPPPAAASTGLYDSIEFYKIVSRKLRWREWYRTTGILTAIVGWILGRLGISITGAQRVPRVPNWRALEIQGNALPPDVQHKFARRTMELVDAGFHSPVFYHITNRFVGYEEYAVMFCSPSGNEIARVFWVRALPGHAVRPRFECSFTSGFDDGRYLMTTDVPQSFDRAPEVKCQNRAGTSMAFLWHWHEETLRTMGSAPVRKVGNADQIWEVFNAFEELDFSFNEARGVFVHPNPEETATDLEMVDADRAGVAHGGQYGEAWGELQKLRISKKSAINGLIILAVTIVLSIGAGLASFSLKTVWIILAVLLFHEMGHYVAMRFFKYRDVRMFFIPFLGAAVTGKHFNVAGWKKAVVSLLGPVPGIFLGAALGAYAIWADHDLLGEISFFLLMLNVFNLLPILPLDGGWFWNAILFCRHRWLESSFKLLAGLAGIGATMAGFGKFWLYLGIITMASIPMALMVGGAAARLKRKGYQPSKEDDDAIPVATADEIFAELQTAAKGKLNAKALAVNTQQVYERLNATPPNWWESIGLSTVYFVSVAVAVVSLVFVVVFQIDPERLGKEMEKQAKVAEALPTLDAEFSGEIKHAPAAKFNDKLVPRFVLVHFPTVSAADESYASLLTQQPPNVDLTCFAQSVLFTTPHKKSSAPKLISAIQAGGGKVFDSGESFFSINLATSAPDLATAATIQEELSMWLELPMDLRPTAPWRYGSAVDPAEVESIRKSCRTFQEIEKERMKCADDPEIKKLSRKNNIFSLLRSPEKASERYRLITQTRQRLEQEAITRLQARQIAALDPAVIAHALRMPQHPMSDYKVMRTWRAEMRQLLTREPILVTPEKTGTTGEEDSEDEAIDEDEEYEGPVEVKNSISGESTLTGTSLVLKHLHFAFPTRDLPELTKWLASKGCTNLRYGVDKPDYGSMLKGMQD